MKAEEYLCNILYTSDANKLDDDIKEYGALRASEAVEEYKQSLISQESDNFIRDSQFTPIEIINVSIDRPLLMEIKDVERLIQIIEAKHQNQLKEMVSIEKVINALNNTLFKYAKGVKDSIMRDFKYYISQVTNDNNK